MKTKNNFLVIVAVILFIEATSQKAHAYLDPGTGSLVIQVILASVATVLIFFKSIWQGIKGMFGGFAKGESQENKGDE